MAGQKFTLTFDANLNVSQIKGALGQIQSALNGLHLPQNITKGLQTSFNSLSKEVQNFEAALSRDITSKVNFDKLNKQAEKITAAFEKLKIQVKDITGLSNAELEKMLPSDIVSNINNATKAMGQYEKSVEKAKEKIVDAQGEVDKFKQKITNISNKTPLTDAKWKELNTAIKNASEEVDQYKNQLEQAKVKQKEIANNLKQPEKSSKWRAARDEVNDLVQKLEEAQKRAKALSAEKAGSTTYTKQAQDIAKFTTQLTEAETKLKNAQEILTNLETGTASGGFKELVKQVEQLTGLNLSNFTGNIEDLRNIVRQFATGEVDKLKTGFDQLRGSVDSAGQPIRTFTANMREASNAYQQFNTQAQEVDMLKRRIQLFFGLNNAINLVKRTMREAYQTIKELDKAMTETAVVTDFSVGDMWAQLPEYTKRANELGVTTKAAYEAATLYYQQGLKTNEVTALSNETLRMARIAGLEAAEATDRMTNALRGFNMALTEANAQRVDDVYSRLAAISASNVDEISTAMTKVASLAHNAGMEFETTAAFLAQIIETTRESAETAGTALKTVVARFSEVKKLVDENELSGTDEEGEVIDVNRVSQALRTAGIDLNKYFLGEVGIDDIFMELASKWDSLTTMQQRYIATQAAGSRQQSRFIALMSDYARTQELVGEAYNANGAAAKQFAKTQESLESKLARLKNAWHEFAMGILNSDLVKVGVDLLTNILYGINALTSGFGALDKGIGGVINSASKLITLLGALRLGSGIIGGIAGGTQGIASAMGLASPAGGALATLGMGLINPFTKISGKIQSFKNKNAAYKDPTWYLNPEVQRARQEYFNARRTKDLQAISAARNNYGQVKAKAGGIYATPNTLFGALGNKFVKTKVGGAISTGLGSALGKLGIGSGAALGGAATLAATLGVVAAVGTTAYVIIKKLYDASPAGQLKIAEKYAKAIQGIADEANNTKRQLTSIQDEYSELSKAVDNADTIEERSEAIKARNEYIKSLLEQNEIYSQYVSRDKIDGEIVLTLDDEKLTSAIEKATNQIVNAASHFAQANVVQQRIDILQEEIDKIYNGTKQSSIGYDNGSPYTYYVTRDLTAEESGKITQLQVEIDSLREEQASYATQGFKQFLSSDFSEATSDFLADVLAQTFNGDEFQKAAEEATGPLMSLSAARTKYQSLTGQVADSNLTLSQLKPIIDSIVATQLQQQEALKLKTGFLGADLSEQEIADIIDLYYNKGQNIKRSNLGYLPQLITELEDFLPKQVIEQLKNNFSDLNSFDLNPKKIFRSSFYSSTDAYEDLTAASNRFLENSDLNLSQNQLRTVNNLLNDLALTNFDAIPEFSDLLLNLIKATPEDELDSLFSILKSIDLNDAKSIQKAFGLISGLDIDLDSFGYSIDEASNYLIKLSGAVQKLDFEKLQEELSKTVDLLRNVRERDENNRIFSKQEFESIMAAGGNRNDFYYTGISGSEYVYIGDSLDTIVSLLTQQLVTEQENTVHNLQEKVDRGTALVNSDEKIFVNGRELEISEAIVSIASTDFSEGIDQDLVSSLKNSKILQEIYGQEALQGMTPEALIEALQILSTTITDLETNQNNLNTAIRDYTEAINYNTVQPTINWQNDFPTMSSVNGNVDVFNRKQVAFNEENFGSWIPYYKNILHEASDARDEERYAMAQGILEAIQAGDSYATLWSQGIGDENGNEFLFTPILPNGEVLSPETFYKYVDEILHSSDALAADATGIEIDGKLIQGLLIAALGQNPDYEIGQKIHEESEVYYAQDDTSISSKMDTIDAQFNSSENAHLVYDQIRDSIADATEANKAFFDSEDQITTQAQSLSLAWVKQADNLDKLTNTVDKYDSLLTSQEADSLLVSSAIHEIGNAMREAYGAQVTDEFVQAHMEQITLARESAEAYQELLDLLQQEFFANAVQGTENFNQSLYNAQQLMADCIDSGYALSNLKINGVAYLDDTPWISVIEELLDAGANVKAFFNDLGWTTNIEWDSIEMVDGKWILPKNIQLVPNNPTGYRGYTPYTGPGYNRNNKSSSSSASNPTPWENELDWLYNLMEDIAELERQQDKLSELHSRYLNDISKTGRDLYDVTREQLNNLYTQRDNQREALTRRRQEMAEQIGVSGYGRYVQWNDKDQTIEIDWNAIEAIRDKDTYDEINDLISKVEKIQDEMDEASDALFDIEDKIKELEERYLKEFTEFQKRVLDAVVKSYQDSIDHLTELNDTINDTNSAILDSLQKEIDYSRQIRDNTDTENEIADMESRLAYLRRDTTGANETAIRDLEKQLEDARENYSDTLIDQQLERLSEANDQAAEQRQQQIDLMTAQLDYWQESGALWAEVAQLLDEGLNADGSLIRDSSLEQILQNADGWKAMSQQQREVWANELITSANQAGAYLLKISESLNSLSAGIWAIIPASSVTSQKLQYATGGMNTRTGWAWLDGTANDPEYVLNARQTDAFLRLADVLPSMFEGNSVSTNNLGGNVYVELTMNVGEIGSDYDVDRMVERIKTDIYAASSYRNVNAVSFQR